MAGTRTDTDEVALAAAVRALLTHPLTPALLDAYFAGTPASPFAGRLFDTYGENPPDAFSSDDLLAASLLDVRFGPPAVRAIVVRGEFNEDLAALNGSTEAEPAIADLATDDELYQRVSALYGRLLAVPDVGPTRASKLLARKRPALVPIGDSVIRQSLGISERELWWRSLARVLALEDIAASLDQLRAPLPGVTPLRVLDVAAWMLNSESRAARAARAAAA